MQNITLRLGQKGDARKRIDVHRRAIHEIASNDYPPEILNSWGRILSPEVLKEREAKHDARIEKGNDIFVVAEINNKIVGFGEVVVSTSELTAMYIDPDFKRQGIATLIFKCLESIAREKGLKYLHLSSSLTAVPFYQKNGFIVKSTGTHTLSTGMQMACVKMSKQYYY